MPMPGHLTLEIVTPDRAVVSQRVDEVQVPGGDGSFGVLPGHTPLLTTLQVGELWYRTGEETARVAVSFGFAEVQPDRLTILAQMAESAEDIDTTRAEAARKRAADRLAQPSANIDIGRARVALQKSLVRLKIVSQGNIRD